MIERMEAASDPIAEGKAILVDYLLEISEIPGVAGAHIMAPNNDDAVPDVITNSAIAARVRIVYGLRALLRGSSRSRNSGPGWPSDRHAGFDLQFQRWHPAGRIERP